MAKKFKFALILVLIFSLSVISVYADTLFIEAENGTNSTFTIGNDADAYGGKYISSAELEKEITYKFTIEEAGKYIIWARVYATNDTDNSMFFTMDGQGLEGQENYIFDYYEPSEYEIAENRYTPDNFREPEAYYGYWYWLPLSYRNVNVDPNTRFNLVEFNLNTGEHTLVINPREAGARMDKLIVTNDMSYDPTKISIDPEEQWDLDNMVVEEAPAEETPAPVEETTPTPSAPQTSDNNMISIVLLAFATVFTASIIVRKRKVR